MITLACIMSIATAVQGFTLDASGTTEVVLPVGMASARALLLTVRTLEQHMPGVTGIAARPDGAYEYRTERDIPFSDPMRTTFIVRCCAGADGEISYRTPDTAAVNWMQFRFALTPEGEGRTLVRMTLRVRLVRASGTEIHLLAPVLGEEFLNERMQNDITGMLEQFAERLEAQCTDDHTGGTDAQ